MPTRQRWIALLLFVLSTGLYILTRQRALWGDGIFLEGKLLAGDLAYGQIFYLPLVWTVWSCLGAMDISAETALKVVSALAGGAGVALTFLIGCRALASTLRGLSAALLLSGLFGYWFHATATELHMVHAACALVLFLGLIGHVDVSSRTTPQSGAATVCLLFLGTALTLASHTSGIALVLPVLYVACVSRRARAAHGQLLVAVGAGLVVFSACYLWLASGHPEMQKYADDHATKMLSVLTAPGTLPHKVMSASRELLLFAVPASTLVPAGLRVLFHTSPRHAWLCLLWVVAWPLVVLPVDDFAYGSYHMPTLPVQAILAVTAWHGVATSAPRALAALALAFLPAVLVVAGAATLYWSLGVWILASTVLFWMARNHTPRPRWLLALPIVSLLFSASYLAPLLKQDPIRERIRAVAAVIGEEDLVFYLANDTLTHHHWRRFFPGAAGAEPRAVNPRLLDHDPTLLSLLRSRMREARDGKPSLWLVGNLDEPAGGPAFQEFRDLLREQCSMHAPEGVPEQVFLLTPKGR